MVNFVTRIYNTTSRAVSRDGIIQFSPCSSHRSAHITTERMQNISNTINLITELGSIRVMSTVLSPTSVWLFRVYIEYTELDIIWLYRFRQQ